MASLKADPNLAWKVAVVLLFAVLLAGCASGGTQGGNSGLFEKPFSPGASANLGSTGKIGDLTVRVSDMTYGYGYFFVSGGQVSTKLAESHNKIVSVNVTASTSGKTYSPQLTDFAIVDSNGTQYHPIPPIGIGYLSLAKGISKGKPISGEIGFQIPLYTDIRKVVFTDSATQQGLEWNIDTMTRRTDPMTYLNAVQANVSLLPDGKSSISMTWETSSNIPTQMGPWDISFDFYDKDGNLMNSTNATAYPVLATQSEHYEGAGPILTQAPAFASVKYSHAEFKFGGESNKVAVKIVGGN